MVKPIQLHGYSSGVPLKAIGVIPTLSLGNSLKYKTKFVSGRTPFFKMEPNYQFAAVATQGWGLCTKFHMDGSRTVIDLVLPGDIASTWHSADIHELVIAVNDVVLAVLHEDTAPTSTCTNDLRQLLYSSIQLRHARVVERMAMAGRVGALERLSQLLIELGLRSGVSINSKAGSYECPLSQTDIGDALGLSGVHVNRILRELRIRNLACMRHGLITLPDIAQLIDISGYDALYLNNRGKL